MPPRRGINRRISKESLMALFSCSFVTQRGLIGEELFRVLRLHESKSLCSSPNSSLMRFVAPKSVRNVERISTKLKNLFFLLTALDLELACEQGEEGPGIGDYTDCLRRAPVHQLGQVGGVDIDTDRFHV